MKEAVTEFPSLNYCSSSLQNLKKNSSAEVGKALVQSKPKISLKLIRAPHNHDINKLCVSFLLTNLIFNLQSLFWASFLFLLFSFKISLSSLN